MVSFRIALRVSASLRFVPSSVLGDLARARFTAMIGRMPSVQRRFPIVLVLLVLSCGTSSAADQPDLTHYVDPFIGTAWTEQLTHDFAYDCGNTFPGAAYPMGMVQWSPDTPGTK